MTNEMSTVRKYIDMNKVEYRLGVSYQEAMDAMNRTINGLYGAIEILQQRVLTLELKESGDSE